MITFKIPEMTFWLGLLFCLSVQNVCCSFRSLSYGPTHLSVLDLILGAQGVPALNSPPLSSNSRDVFFFFSVSLFKTPICLLCWGPKWHYKNSFVCCDFWCSVRGPCDRSPLWWAVLLVYWSHLLPHCSDWEPSITCTGVTRELCHPPLPATHSLPPKAPLNEPKVVKVYGQPRLWRCFSVCLAGTGVLCSASLPQPCPCTALVWGGWSRAERAELLWGRVGGSGPSDTAQPRHQPGSLFSALPFLSISPLERAPGALVSLQCSRRRLQGTSCTPPTPVVPLPFCQRLCPAMVGSSSAEGPLLPWWSPAATNSSEPIVVFTDLAFTMGLHFSSHLTAGKPWPCSGRNCVFKGSFPCSFRNILVHIDFVGLKCFVFLQLL